MQGDYQVSVLSFRNLNEHRAIATKIPGLNREEMQLGNTKVILTDFLPQISQIFIRHPETYFQIEKLREVWLIYFDCFDESS